MVKPTLKPYGWRVSAVKVLDVAEDAATFAEAEAKRTAAFEGQYNALGQREGTLVRAVYENRDCYMGQYTDDQRSGKGMYIHANKGAFAGESHTLTAIKYDYSAAERPPCNHNMHALVIITFPCVHQKIVPAVPVMKTGRVILRNTAR